MMKTVFTEYNNCIVAILFDEQKVVSVRAYNPDTPSLIGNIYLGRVEKCVKNIDAAFIDIGDGKKGYLSLKDNDVKGICEGMKLPVQVIKDAIKTKDAVLSTTLEIAGRYVVSTRDGVGEIYFSKKLNTIARKRLTEALPKNFGGISVTIRTAAGDAYIEDILKEIAQHKEIFEDIFQKTKQAKCGDLLYCNGTELSEIISDYSDNGCREFISEDAGILSEISRTNNKLMLTLHKNGNASLSEIYKTNAIIEELISRRVWLKSGAYLYIDAVEAMTVIDVNTGKNVSKTANFEQTILNVNMEAATKIAEQIRLRNISGIIVIDFINMKNTESKDKLFKYLKTELKKDKIKTELIDRTALDLYEIVREKKKKTFKSIICRDKACMEQ